MSDLYTKDLYIIYAKLIHKELFVLSVLSYMQNFVRSDGGWFPDPLTPMTGIIKSWNGKKKKKNLQREL